MAELFPLPKSISELTRCMGMCDDDMACLLNPTWVGYRRISIRKKGGGTRTCWNPHPTLRKAQSWVLEMLSKQTDVVTADMDSSSPTGNLTIHNPNPVTPSGVDTPTCRNMENPWVNTTPYRHGSKRVSERTFGVADVPNYRPVLAANSVSTLKNRQYGRCNTERVNDVVHSYRKGRSALTHAAKHVGQRYVITADIECFFPSITYDRVVAQFMQLGYKGKVAGALGMICTTGLPSATPKGRYLAQGALTSPALSNLIGARLDRRILALAIQYGFVYTRYADDIALSTSNNAPISRIVSLLEKIVLDEGYRIHQMKIQPSSEPQIVTGYMVNKRVELPTEKLHDLVYSLRTAKPAERDGIIAYLNMVYPKRINWQEIAL